MSFLWFLEALPAALVAPGMGPTVLFKGEDIARNMMKNMQELWQTIFTTIHNLL